MNVFMSVIFLIVIFIFYSFLGECVLNLLKISKSNSIKKIITGFISTFFIHFIVGFPFQIMHLSWDLYFILMCSIYIFLIFYIIYTNDTKRKKIKNVKSILNWNKVKDILINHFKNYWLIYVLVILFSILSMSNQQPFYKMNYDDSYYIGKIQHLIHTPQILNENYFNGALADLNNVSLERYINTYELTYSFFSFLFQISVPYFCRATMVIHNFILVALVYLGLSLEIMPKKKAQYVFIPFSIFLITFGYLNMHFFIRMFDGWQFQTAIFYGSSVVRVLSIPILLYYTKDLIEKFDVKQFIFVIMICVTMMSFSTIFLQIGVILSYILIFYKCCYLWNMNHKKRYLLFMLLLVSFILGVSWIGYNNSFGFSSLDDRSDMFLNYTKYGRFFVHGFIIFFITYFLNKNIFFRRMVIIIGAFYFMYRLPIFKDWLEVTSVDTWFVSLRTLSAIEHMMIFILGVAFVSLFNHFNNIFFNIFSLLIVTASLKFNMQINFAEYDYLGSGVSYDGFSMKRLLQDENMTPQLVAEIGDYFDDLEYGNHKILLDDLYPYDNTFFNSIGFVIASNNIEICLNGGCELNENEMSLIESFYSSEIEFEEIQQIIEERNIEYALINQTNQKENLEKFGAKVVMTYNNDGNYFYLMKLK